MNQRHCRKCTCKTTDEIWCHNKYKTIGNRNRRTCDNISN